MWCSVAAVPIPAYRGERMAEQTASGGVPGSGTAEWTDAPASRPATGPTGKPYEWHLAEPECPEYVALSPEALAERAFVRQAEFKSVLQRASAYLVVVSRMNLYEGRNPLLITDDVRCGAVADFLGIDLDLLGRALLEMRRRGMVSFTDAGDLHLDNLQALDDVSEGR
jgi:hypothetical protein